MKRDAFAWGYLACFIVTELVYASLSGPARAALVAWASTNVANLEHEPVGPLVVSAFVAPGYLVTWPVLIALAVFGAGRAIGSVRAALVCAAGHVIGTLVSEGIVAFRVQVGGLPHADRYLTDVGPSYVVVSAIVAVLICGSRLARVAALADFALLVFPGGIFAGLTQLDVAAVGHLTAVLTAAAAVAPIGWHKGRHKGQRTGWRTGRRTGWPIHRRSGSGREVTDAEADQVGDPGGEDPEYQLP